MTQKIMTSRAGSSTASPETIGGATRALLVCGVIGGPLFVITALIQSATRSGFDLKRHAFSMLSLGNMGWIQIANFVVSGLLFMAAAVGMWRALHGGRGGTWGPLLVGAFGAGTVGGGVFLVDPAYGFPAGAPAGRPEVISWHGNVHGAAFAVGMLSLTAAFIVFARRSASRKERGFAWYSAATAVAFLALSVRGLAGADFRFVAVAVVLGWGWTAILAARLISQLRTA